MSPLESVAAALGTALPDVPVLLGGEYLQQADVPPRIVLVPTKDTFQGARSNGLPRSLKTRVAGFALWLFGPDVSGTETLINRTVGALQTEGPTVLRVVEGEWEEGSTATELGDIYRLHCQLDVPITAVDDTDEVQPTDTSSAFDLEDE